MKVSLRGIVIVFVLIGIVSTMSALESTLIDFSDVTIGDKTRLGYRNLFGDAIPVGLSVQEQDEIQSSLAIEEWEIDFSVSSQRTDTLNFSQIREVQVRAEAQQYAGETVMGVRLFFPVERYNSWALIRPPFDVPLLPVEDPDGGPEKPFWGFGAIDNVGAIASISLTVYGLNYPHAISLIIDDQEGEQREYSIGTLDFEGWRTLNWMNPAYEENVERRDLAPKILYPDSIPSIRLVGIRIYRNALHRGGDFITYIRDIEVDHDEAAIERAPDIDNEEAWGIIADRDSERSRNRFRRIGELGLLRYYEGILQHKEE